MDSGFVFKFPNTLRKNLVHNNSSNFNKNSRSCIYKINCKNCNGVYFGETGRSLDKRIIEHKKDIVNINTNNALCNHIINSNHSIDFHNVKVLHNISNARHRRIIESAYISVNDNNFNQNKGFYPVNNHISNCLVNSVT